MSDPGQRDTTDLLTGVLFSVLGPLDSRGFARSFAGDREQQVLALLLDAFIRGEDWVGTQRLAALWGSGVSSADRVYTQIDRMRTGGLGLVLEARRRMGYRLSVRRAQVDGAAFWDTVNSLLSNDELPPLAKDAALRAALQMWKGGAAFQGVRDVSLKAKTQLENLRQSAIRQRIRINYALGATSDVHDLLQSYEEITPTVGVALLQREMTGWPTPASLGALGRRAACADHATPHSAIAPPSAVVTSPSTVDSSDSRTSLERTLLELQDSLSEPDLDHLFSSVAADTARDQFSDAARKLEQGLVVLSLQGHEGLAWEHRRAAFGTALANIRRDQGWVTGINGALPLYFRALEFHRTHGDQVSAAEIEFYLGACYEMSGRLDIARSLYEDGEELLETVPSRLAIRARCILRQGTVLTKQGYADEGLARIDMAIRELYDVGDEQLLEFAHQKRALALAAQGHADVALDLLAVNSTEKPAPSLRRVQRALAIAEVQRYAQHTDRAVSQAESAIRMAEDFGFGHQASVARVTYQRLTGAPSTVPHRTTFQPATQAPLMDVSR